MFILPPQELEARFNTESGKVQVRDPIRRKWVALTPEEAIRQHLLRYLLDVKHWNPSLVAVERALPVQHRRIRFDVVTFAPQTGAPWLLVECKSPDVPLTEATAWQLAAYNRYLQAPYLALINGPQGLIYHLDGEQLEPVTDLPEMPKA
jgi:hypothetical protein